MSSQRLVGLMYLVNREMEKISTQLTILVFARNSSTEKPNAV